MNTLIGNEQVTNRLRRLIDQRRVPHLLLFSGPDGVGKKLFAKAFAAEWLSKISKRTIDTHHVDIQIVCVEGKTGMHSIASMRKLLDDIVLSPFEASGRAIIIDDAERMLPTSSNILLKTLEEPPKNTCIILISSEKDRLLPTIVSRAQEVRFGPCSYEEVCSLLTKHHTASSDDIHHVAERAQGSLGMAIRLLEKSVDDMQTKLFEFLSSGDYLIYHRLQGFSQEVQTLLDDKKNAHQEVLRKELYAENQELAKSKSFDQEIEGALAAAWSQDVTMLLRSIAAFFRDLEVVNTTVDAIPLFFSHEQERLIQCSNQGQSVPLEQVLVAIDKAKIALERSTPLQHVLEGVFLQLSE